MPPNYPISVSYVEGEGYLVVLKKQQQGIVVRTYLGLMTFISALEKRDLKRGLDFANLSDKEQLGLEQVRKKRLSLEQTL